MDDLVFVILRVAVNLARDEGLHSIKALRSRLSRIYPDNEEQCKDALLFWQSEIRKSHRNVDRY